MANFQYVSDDDLPSLEAIIQPRRVKLVNSRPTRRSPRKHNTTDLRAEERSTSTLCEAITLMATSTQVRLSPAKDSSTIRSPLRTIKQPQVSCPTLKDNPVLPKKNALDKSQLLSTNQRPATGRSTLGMDSLSLQLSKLAVEKRSSNAESELSILDARKRTPSSSKSVMSLMTEAARAPAARSVAMVQPSPKKTSKTISKYTTRSFILGEARCDDDLADTDAENDGEEDEDTDLSGFVVDDNAELSFHGSIQSDSDHDSEVERRQRRNVVKDKPRRRLQRGRKQVSESEDESVSPTSSVNNDLAETLQEMKIEARKAEHTKLEGVEVIDLTSPAPKSRDSIHDTSQSRTAEDDLFKSLKAMKLSPPKEPRRVELPARQYSVGGLILNDDPGNDLVRTVRDPKFTTPPATPPRSPTKLKSPVKQILSPSKRAELPPRSLCRPSLDAFWDHNVVNEFHDQYSPKKAPLTSPRKILDRFHLWSDAEDDKASPESQISSDSLPSPCESPSKTRMRSSPLKSPEKAERRRIQEAKKADLARKKEFEACKDRLAHELLEALDEHVTNSRLAAMTASTGGVQIIWSKNLRSTAGRAQWRRTTTKAKGSLDKSELATDEKTYGSIVEHFAKIELATKVIDRPERLVSTLTHEFCHLANYMVSGIRDQPHGASFHEWGRKCIKWLREESGRADWKHAEVATKHSYEIDFKYLWVCTGRPRTMAMDILNLQDEEGCGAEYGRHSKSVDTEKHRCGRCKGRLVQVRPKPRASPTKTSPVKNARVQRGAVSKMELTTKSIEIVEVSD